ncbi:protein of unknown function [Cupriavidus taiwanensis]|nr:protein of unknown function [Cupriavidus taiwanensis]
MASAATSWVMTLEMKSKVFDPYTA